MFTPFPSITYREDGMIAIGHLELEASDRNGLRSQLHSKNVKESFKALISSPGRQSACGETRMNW